MAIKLGDETRVPANVMTDLHAPQFHLALRIGTWPGLGPVLFCGDTPIVGMSMELTRDEQDAWAVLITHKVNAYNALVATLHNLLRECELTAPDLRPRRAGPMRAKMRHARQVLGDINEGD